MISKLFLVTGATIAAVSDAGSMETIKDILLIAFLVVGIVWLLIDARRNLIATYGGGGAPALVAAPVSAPVARPVPAGQPTPEILAVIAAAVHTALGRSARIVSIATDDDDAQIWAVEGRRAIYATRKVR